MCQRLGFQFPGFFWDTFSAPAEEFWLDFSLSVGLVIYSSYAEQSRLAASLLGRFDKGDIGMKPERIIYYNEASWLLEYCNKGDLAQAKSVTMFGMEYVTKDIVEELFANNIFVVEKRYPNNPSDGVKIEFAIKNRSDDRIDIETFVTISGRKSKFGDIIYKSTPTKIRNLVGDASIELVNIDILRVIIVGAPFGAFALGVGMYLFCKLDGKWSDEKKQEHDAALKSTKDLQSAIAKRKQEQLLLTQEIEAKKKEFDAEVQKLEAKLNEQQKEIYYLEKEIAALEEGN